MAEVPTPENDSSALEEMRQRLYANAAPPAFPAPTQVPVAPATLPEAASWQPPAAPKPKKKIGWSVMFLIFATVVFVAAIGIATYFLFFGGRAISPDNIEITVAPVAAIKSGETATLLVNVKNNNPTTITSTKLHVVFPDSARDAVDPLLPRPFFDDTLGDIAPGESRPQTVQVILAGAEGEVVTLPLKFEYKTEGSVATFVKEVTQTVTITSSPLSVQVSVPTGATKGQEIAIQVQVHSTAPVAIENVAILGEYPFGFVPTKTGTSTTLFEVGTLAPGKDASITVRGTLTGEDTDQRVFRFMVGTKGVGNTLARTFAMGQGSLTLAHQFLSTTLSVNGNSGSELVIPSGQLADARVLWTNTLPTEISDAQIAVRLTGDALEPSSVTTSGGFYRSIDSTVLFARDTSPGLARLAPLGTGNGSFSFSTKQAQAMKTLRNPTVTATITVSGRTSTDGGAPTPMTATMTRVIQVGTEFGFTARASRTTGPFKNTGAIPPVANKESTYTILLGFTSTVNAVAGASAHAVLPSYVRFVGATSPSDGSITYDATSHTVTWNAGEVAAGSAFGTPKSAAFQVALLPSTSQVGTSPTLMSSISYSGTDRFTKRLIEGSSAEVTIQTSMDPGYQGAYGVVVR